jgi:hypothetical protein
MLLISHMNFVDLPGSEILMDDPETIRIRQGTTLNRGILAVSGILKELGTNKNAVPNYD